MFLRFGIADGVKRVKLAIIFYRRQRCRDKILTEDTYPNPREYRVIELVAQGLKNSDIAAEIDTTENVVKNYLRAIYDKLGLWNRVELALWHEARRFDATVN